MEFVAHENAKANLSQATCPSVTNCDAFKGDNAKFLPKRTFADKLTLLKGKDRIDLYYFGRGHTNGDTWVVFPALRAMHTGDMFQRKNMPFIDAANNGGNALEFAQTLDRAAATIQGVDTGDPRSQSDADDLERLQGYTGYYGEFVAAVRKAVESGKSASDAASAYRPSERYKTYETDEARIKQNAESIHASLKRGQ